MELLKMSATKNTPEVILDPSTGTFEINGLSYPESTRDVYTPVMEWLDKYAKEIAGNIDNPISFHFKLRYINSSSFKYLLEIMKKMTDINETGVPVEIIWHYEDIDDDIKDTGEHLFKSTSIKLPFKYIPYHED